GRGNQHSRWDQAAKRVRSRINRHSDWFTRAHSPGCEVGGELQPLAIVFSPRRCRELSRFRRNGMQSERASLAKHDADQAGSEQCRKTAAPITSFETTSGAAMMERA